MSTRQNKEMKSSGEIKEEKEEMDDDEPFYVTILIREKSFRQFCGRGHQKLRWLTDCAIFKYENSSDKRNSSSLGIAYGLKSETGELCNLEHTIAEELTNNANVMVLLKEEYEY